MHVHLHFRSSDFTSSIIAEAPFANSVQAGGLPTHLTPRELVTKICFGGELMSFCITMEIEHCFSGVSHPKSRKQAKASTNRVCQGCLIHAIRWKAKDANHRRSHIRSFVLATHHRSLRDAEFLPEAGADSAIPGKRRMVATD